MERTKMNNGNKKKLTGIHYVTRKAIEVHIENGHIIDICFIEMQENLPTIAPGLIDIQINGYLGIDFNRLPLNFSEWKLVATKLAAVGITTFYPTIITNSFSQLSLILKEAKKHLDEGLFPVDMIGGFHLEGPYISEEDGPRGAHSKDFVRAPNWIEFSKLQEISGGMIKILTLSPEWSNSTEFIEKVVKSGVKVAIGHTAASTQDIHESVRAGATLSTHLGNGAHLNLPRHPNYIWDQLAEENLWATVISDGHHLPENVLKVINKVKQNRMILISDSVAIAGLAPGNYTAPVGGEVILTENGRLHLKESPNLLAGSAQDLLQGIQYLIKREIVGFSDAINKASIYPAEFLGLSQQLGLEIGAPADLILIDHSGEKWKVIETMAKGNILYKEGSD